MSELAARAWRRFAPFAPGDDFGRAACAAVAFRLFRGQRLASIDPVDIWAISA